MLNPLLERLSSPWLAAFESDEDHTATAKSLKEDEEVLKAGLEYVTERNGAKIYRNRK